MAINTRTASKTCIYWNGSHCIANTFFPTTDISCYNSGQCDGSGTCLDCSRYYYGGFNTLSDVDSQRLFNTYPASYDQIPMNVLLHNLKAKLFKCCKWNGSTISLTVDSSGKPTKFDTKCVESRATDWQVGWQPGSRNQSSFPCNGAKSTCPYYTGPQFVYATDSKMETGSNISAAQIMELRFYSKDWSLFSNPTKAYNELFGKVDPAIWAWNGDYDDAVKTNSGYIPIELEADATEASLPRLVEVTLFKDGEEFDSKSFEESLFTGQPVIATKGSLINGVSKRFPTLIKELSDVIPPLQIRWPSPTSTSEPFVFRSFRLGANKIYIIVKHDSEYPLYAVNLTKRPQPPSLTDEKFIEYMLDTYPDDIYIHSEFEGTNGSIFTVDLEYGEKLNYIKVYTSKGNSTDGSMYTDTCYIKHKFYHAHLAQTSFVDNYGHSVVEPWVEKFVDFDASVSVKQLSPTASTMGDVLWDTVAYNKTTIYEIETYVEEENVSWVQIDCNSIAITLSNLNINPVQGWKIDGNPTAPYISTKELGVWVDRTLNPNLGTIGSSRLIKMSVIFKSDIGVGSPSNVVFVAPDTADSNYNEDYVRLPFDKKYDTVIAKFAYTEYKQGPIASDDISKLKYLQRYSNNPSSNQYIDVMPYDVTVGPNYFNISGLSFAASPSGSNTITKRFTVQDFEDIIAVIEKATDDNERKAIESFADGGTQEDDLLYLGQEFIQAESEFNSENEGLVFEDGTSVTLSNLCTKLSWASYYEGTQEYRAVFKDETGRPVGIKRLYLLMQSSIPSCRDVEIYYKWKTKREAAFPMDDVYLLADYYRPMVPGGPMSNGKYIESIYVPKCGDHNNQSRYETFYTKTQVSDEVIRWDTRSSADLLASFKNPSTYNSSGIMWYPYKACSMPHYHRDDPRTDYVLCSSRVEGFKQGKRRSYWEATRGEDFYWAITIQPQLFIGCTWSYIDSNYHTIGAPIFDGYTRIRSGHIFGSYQMDRESLRVSRHYKKTNVKVRDLTVRVDETSGAADNSAGSMVLTDEGTSTLFPGGDSDINEKPVWVHEIDGLSVVNRTTPSAKHPFSNIVMRKEGPYSVNEQVDTSTRYSAYEIFTHRDLLLSSARDESGSQKYTPEELRAQLVSDLSGGFSAGSDIFWVYNNNNQNIGWTWLEIPKDIDRATTGARIGGIHLYNPSVSAWSKDLKLAAHSEEGVHDLIYTPPVFNEVTGAIIDNPTLTWFDGRPRQIDWATGILGGMAGRPNEKDVYDSSSYPSDDGTSFQMYGKVVQVTSTSIVNGFLADDSGSHVYEDQDGNKVRTLSGIGINPVVSLYLLPSNNVNAFTLNTEVYEQLIDLETQYSLDEKTFDVNLKGYKYVYSLDINYSIGINNEEQKEYMFPGLYVNGITLDDKTVTDIFRVDAARSKGNFVSNSISLSIDTFSRYKSLKIRIPKMPQKTFIKINSLTITIGEPTTRTEKVRSYERKFAVSRFSDVGTRDKHSDMYYYYGRSFAQFGLNGVSYDEIDGQTSTDSKWTARTVKDILLTYFFMDPTGDLYDYPNSRVNLIEDIEQPNTDSSGLEEVQGGVYYIDGPLRIHTKGQTVITSQHVTDPIEAASIDLTASDIESPDEYFTDAIGLSRGLQDEEMQVKLYKYASKLLGYSSITLYDSFWHPDEISFFKDTVGLPEMPTWSLRLASRAAKFNRIMRHQNYGCEANTTNEYHDGRIHRIPPWKALGHLLYFGNPVWNWTCFKVIMNKVSTHLGEDLFEKNPSVYVESRRWPSDQVVGVEVRGMDYYIDRGLIDNPATYVGGTMSPTIPIRAADASSYVPGGVPNAELLAISLFPQTYAWPPNSDSLIPSYNGFSSR